MVPPIRRATRHAHRAMRPQPYAKPAAQKSAPKQAAPVDSFQPAASKATVLGGGDPAIDFNGTKYTSVEGSAADSAISIGKGFDPLTRPGIALTTQQASQLGVKVGDSVTVRDTKTGKTVSAVFYDSAGGARSDKNSHLEVDPALADALGIRYRNSAGKVVDAVTNTESLVGRFVIEK